MVDDGNLPCAFSMAASDLLTQLDKLLLESTTVRSTTANPLLSKCPSFFTTMIAQSICGKLILDPSYDELHISNNLLTVTCLSTGKQLLDKSLAFRTPSGGTSSVEPLELKPHSMTLLDLAQAVNLAKTASVVVFS